MQSLYSFINERSNGREIPHYMKNLAYEVERHFTSNLFMPRILMISMPPRSLKTTLSLYTISWIMENFDNKKIGYSSYNENITKINHKEISNIIKPAFNYNNYIYVLPILSNKYVDFNVLIIDDYFKDIQESSDINYSNKVFSWFYHIANYNFSNNMFILIISTSWGNIGLIQDILYNVKLEKITYLVDYINIPAIKNDQSFWPEKYSINTLKQIECQIGKDAFRKMYQGEFKV